MRKLGRHRTVSLDTQTSGDDAASGSYARMLQGSDLDPLASLEGAERQQWVREALGRLPQYLRTVVVLAYYQGLKYREIAEILDVPVGTVKSRLHAAIARIAQAWKQSQPVQEQ